jgi:hypothetical protein
MNREEIRQINQLTKEQLDELQKRYYAGESTKLLIQEFELKGLRPGQITCLFDNIKTDLMCEYCDVFMEQLPPTRTTPNKEIVCPLCGHTIFNNTYNICWCKNCIKKREDEENRIKKEKMASAIEWIYREHESEKTSLDSIGDWDKILLGAIVNFAFDEELIHIEPLYDNEKLLMPDEDSSLKMLRGLYEKGLIVLSEKNYLNSFTFDKNNNATSFDLDKVYYDLWVKEETACDELLNATFDLSKESKLIYWREINKLEAINYLISIFDKIKIYNFNPGKKTNDLFNKLVEKFSLSQIFRMINYIKDKTSKDILSKEKTVQHAANSTISRLESYAARVLFEGYSLYKVKYEDNLSMITTYFYNRILCMGDSAFYEIPQMELII